ncbi:hypothetical protein [Hymenobacter perfusus]|uniref:Transmembrane protein n=1 Tax=Hymenobacter perfusus TaxID=1236770 RepID=A0A3R9MZ42_9BACT|nr:hypothetical protein [Hymenobacter perfusus]RSK44301.1 hypothetical protein EI293_07110 [Hymenobacter perfusus]
MTTPTRQITQAYPLIGSTRLTMQDNNLRIEEKRFFQQTAVDIPYEDLLPIGVGHHHFVPFRLLLAEVFLGFGCGKACYTLITQPNQRESAVWLLLILLGLFLGLGAYILQVWRHDFLITTGRGNIALFHSPRNKALLYDFANALRDHTILYMRRQYATVDPLLPAEPQLARLEWLRSLGALNNAQFHQLKTRLLGRFFGAENILGDEYGLSPSAN